MTPKQFEAEARELAQAQPDAEVAEIEKRHLLLDEIAGGEKPPLDYAESLQCHTDRATLLRYFRARTAVVDIEQLAEWFLKSPYDDCVDVASRPEEVARNFAVNLISSGLFKAMPTEEAIAEAVFEVWAKAYEVESTLYESRLIGETYFDDTARKILALIGGGE